MDRTYKHSSFGDCAVAQSFWSRKGSQTQSSILGVSAQRGAGRARDALGTCHRVCEKQKQRDSFEVIHSSRFRHIKYIISSSVVPFPFVRSE
jgi:hypothetical protein